jgi:hypothetical protein
LVRISYCIRRKRRSDICEGLSPLLSCCWTCS